MNRNLVVLAALAATLSPALIAQGPNRSLVPADAAFVVHVDLRKVAELIGIETLMGHMPGSEADQISGMLRRMERRWGFDPFEDIRSVTVFGSDLSGRHPGVFFITTDALDDALDALDDEGGVRTVRHGGLRFQRISAQGMVDSLGMDEDVGNESLVLYTKRLRGNRRAVLVGERPEDIIDAARVFDDEDLSLAEARHPDLELRPARGSLVYFEAANSLEELLGQTPASVLADKVRGLAVDVSEEQGTVTVQLTVATASRRDARDVEALINGLRGLISLAGGMEELHDIPEFARDMLDELRADTDGNRVTVSVSVPYRQLREMLEQAMKGY